MNKSGQFAILIVSHFTNANVRFWDFISKQVRIKREKVEETQY